MSDLIRREDVIKCLQENGWIDDTNIDELIETIPIAYDIDKVVEKLNELEVKENTRYKNGDFGDFDGVDYYIKKSDAIEIVKQGGVSDYFCEWTQSGDMAISPHTFSKYKIKQCDGLYALSTCPYCGKKIKVV